jgi:molybdopterin/thiamine biosynthesis adenylyltransferase/rhodanese-related sulfurtransferase
MERFKRQLQLPGFSAEAQLQLQQARVLVVGAGGLGCPALIHLASAGIGHITIADFDTIDESNLSRQWLYRPEDVGNPKAVTAARVLRHQFPDVHIQIEENGISQENILSILQQQDVVLDCSDSIQVRYMLNDACELLDIPWVYAGVFQYEGQLSVFNLPTATGRSGNYRDLFPFQEGREILLDCNATGVLCTLTGILGTWQANEAIKVITGIGMVLFNRLMIHNIFQAQTTILEFERGPRLPGEIPSTVEAFHLYPYRVVCRKESSNEITAEALATQLMQGEKWIWLDVREVHEEPKLEDFIFLAFPLSDVHSYTDVLPANQKIVCFCQSGLRSLKALEIIKTARPEIQVLSLKGGLSAWELYRKDHPDFITQITPSPKAEMEWAFDPENRLSLFSSKKKR